MHSAPKDKAFGCFYLYNQGFEDDINKMLLLEWARKMDNHDL